MAYASVASARHAPGDNRFAELRALDQVKRAVAWAAVERAWAKPVQGDTSPVPHELRALDQVKRGCRIVGSGGARLGRVSARAVPVAARAGGDPYSGGGPRPR